MKLLLFAAAREAAGRSQDAFDASSVGEALKIASERYGSSFAVVLARCSILHNGGVVARGTEWDVTVAGDDEIAVLPPVSGGAERVEMVDVAGKDETLREATATCTLHGDASVIARILRSDLPKGDALSAAKIAGTLAAKRTPELIPMCHPVRTTYVGVAIEPLGDGALSVTATVRGRDRTGFEMEALLACSVAALTVYDMSKSEDPRMRVEGLRIVAKSGGKSGSVTYE